MKTVSLNGVWNLKGKRQTEDTDYITLPAKVPGCVQLDLSENGFLPEDLYMGENILQAEKFEDYEWIYERTFEAPEEKENVYLVFEGVDCIADYYLNGVKIGESENMFIAHEFKVDEFLKDGINTLLVHIKSAVLDAHDRDYSLKLLVSEHSLYSRTVRKPPHSFGWDIMPKMITAGIWRDVKLEVRDSIYFDKVFFQTSEGFYRFFYVLDCKFSDLEDVEVEISGGCGENSSFYHREKVWEKGGSFRFGISNPQKWYPYGYGESPVYECIAKIYKQGKLVHENNYTFGIRKVVLERTDLTDGKNGKFRFLVNGIEIMCKGTNWVALDAIHSRDKERLDKALELMKDIGCNMVRCWGGNVYEDTEFFDFCDRNGIMIWQDFAMASAYYPEDEAFKKNMENEVVSVIRKFRNHPSLVVWSGDNEVDYSSHFNSPANNSITRELIKKCIDQNDLGRPYLPSSPYISAEAFEKGARSQVKGSKLSEDHLWGPRDYFKSDFYKNNLAHFVSETGYHGCPDMESIKKFITPDKVWPYKNNSEWILHSTDRKGNYVRVELMEKQVRQLFGKVPESPEDYTLASQISQAEAKKYFIERIRVGRPEKTGILWWNLLDGWPQMSDAVVDYYFKKKLAYGYIKRSQAPFTIAADEISHWMLPVYACNDTLVKKSGTFKIYDAMTEEVLKEGNFEAAENTSTLIASLPIYYSEQRILIFEWDINGEKGFNHYLCGFPPVSFAMYKEFLDKYKLR